MTAATHDVRPLAGAAEALRLGEARIGGKALSLARLVAAGERVPEWVVLPADALASRLRESGAMDLVARALDELLLAAASAVGAAARRVALARAASTLQALVDALPADDALREALAETAVLLGGGPFAVRSSAVGEDGATSSFAGQLDSVLDVDTAALGAAVRRCWRSAFSVRALDYRLRAGTLHDAPRVAVVVQRLVRGEVSGVLFTADPVTGERGHMRVSACRGMGDALVSGAAEADEYLLDRGGRELRGAPLAGPARILCAGALRALAGLGARVERREGGPRDIEWTMRGGELWVLQSRPITATANEAHATNRIVWDNSNIQESYCGVTTPLTFSFARAAYASVYEQTMRALGVPGATIAEHRPTLRTLLGLLRGRVYYNLNSWYRGLLLLPAFRRNKEDMERMMGVEEPVDFVTDEAPGLGERMRRLPRLARTYGGLLAAFATLDLATVHFLARFDAVLRRIDRGSVHRRSLGELMAILDVLERECIARWTTPIVNDFHVMMTAGRLRRIASRAMAGVEEPERVMQSLLGGASAATGPAMPMLRLAALARADGRVRAALERADGARALGAAREACPEFGRALDELLDRYGDRCMGELKLESRSLRDDPDFVVRMLRNYLGGRVADPEWLAETARERREAAEQAVRARLGPLGRARFGRTLEAARRGIARRETMRLARTRLFGTHRDVYRAIGARLHEIGVLDRAEDVLYLTVEEIRGLWEGTTPSADLAATARTRRAEFAAYRAEAPLPDRIVTIGVPRDLPPHAATEARGNGAGARVLRGLGCSAGVAEGIVRLVRSPEDDLAIDGHILVAPRTDPGWAPLFPSARAIVVERGSLLSHSAVLARELGLPAVVGFPGILETLRDGERVRVDGAAGTIERLDEPCAS